MKKTGITIVAYISMLSFGLLHRLVKVSFNNLLALYKFSVGASPHLLCNQNVPSPFPQENQKTECELLELRNMAVNTESSSPLQTNMNSLLECVLAKRKLMQFLFSGQYTGNYIFSRVTMMCSNSEVGGLPPSASISKAL